MYLTTNTNSNTSFPLFVCYAQFSILIPKGTSKRILSCAIYAPLNPKQKWLTWLDSSINNIFHLPRREKKITTLFSILPSHPSRCSPPFAGHKSVLLLFFPSRYNSQSNGVRCDWLRENFLCASISFSWSELSSAQSTSQTSQFLFSSVFHSNCQC